MDPRDPAGADERDAHRHRVSSARPEDPRDLEGRGLLELVVAAVGRRLVRAPALERRPVAEAITLEVVVGDLGDALGAERLPREVLAAVPARGRAGQPLAGGVGLARSRPTRPSPSTGWLASASSRSGASSAASASRLSQVNDDVTPTWWSVPSSSNSPSSSDPMCVPGPFLCQRNPATTQSAVRWCLILSIARLPGWYGASSRFATTPSSPAPSNRSNQSRRGRRGRASPASGGPAARAGQARPPGAPGARPAGSSRRSSSPSASRSQATKVAGDSLGEHLHPRRGRDGCAGAAPRTPARRRAR